MHQWFDYLYCINQFFFFFFLKNRRGVQKNMVYIDDQRVMMKYLFPLNEVVVDFYDHLKSLSSGYAR